MKDTYCYNPDLQQGFIEALFYGNFLSNRKYYTATSPSSFACNQLQQETGNIQQSYKVKIKKEKDSQTSIE